MTYDLYNIYRKKVLEYCSSCKSCLLECKIYDICQNNEESIYGWDTESIDKALDCINKER